MINTQYKINVNSQNLFSNILFPCFPVCDRHAFTHTVTHTLNICMETWKHIKWGVIGEFFIFKLVFLFLFVYF